MPLRVLIADDDPDYATLFARRVRTAIDALEGEETQVETFGSGEALLAAVDAGVDPALVFLDVSMPGRDGLEVLRRLKRARPGLPVVMVSAQTTIRVALDAIELYGPHLIGSSEAMVDVYRTIEKATRGDLAVTILGESGTGKELVAEAIHHSSARAAAPFVVVNSAAIPRDLMESEFFGHEKGAFTGALTRRRGVFELADGGTLFLDEIGDLAPDLQAKLLRVLQDGSLRRVGGYQTLRVDVRVIAATHRDLEQMVNDGAFREDLFYRLCQSPVALPPMRERGADILLLAEHFLRAFAEQHPDVTGRTFSPATRRTLLTYRWPGNVRELKSTVERAALLTDDPVIEPSDLMLQEEPVQLHAAPPKLNVEAEHSVQRATAAIPVEPRPSAAALLRDGTTVDELPTMEEVQRTAFLHAHDVCEGVVEDIVQALDVSRSSVYRMLKRYDLMGGRTWGGPRPNSGPRRRGKHDT